jgi:hypothetical protein
MGLAARFCPLWSGLAGSGAPSIATTCPLPVSATKPMAERVPLAPVQLTVHSMAFPFFHIVYEAINIAAQQIIGYIGASLRF